MALRGVVSGSGSGGIRGLRRLLQSSASAPSPRAASHLAGAGGALGPDSKRRQQQQRCQQYQQQRRSLVVVRKKQERLAVVMVRVCMYL